MLKTTT